jgi:hypothetical protein
MLCSVAGMTTLDREWLFMCFFLGTPVSSTNKADRHDTTEILLKVSLITITLTLNRPEFEPTIYRSGRFTVSVMVRVHASSPVDRGFELRSV